VAESTISPSRGLGIWPLIQLTVLFSLFQDPLGHLCDLIDFATEMTVKLEEINKHSFNNFQLRIGVAVGALGTSRAYCVVFLFQKQFFMNLKGQCDEINHFLKALKISTFCIGADGF
jgi:hypothetical protein